MANKYIFVVCGGDEHIQTLNFSLNYLKKYSDKEIVVLTDLSRNNLIIEHHNIVDVKTPEKYDHHQASIYLKTGLHKFIPPEEDVYCYLDTDVIAVRKKCDSIFENYNSPISFCSDHCKMQTFSPQAIYSFDPNKRNLYLFKQLTKSQNYYIEKEINGSIPLEFKGEIKSDEKDHTKLIFQEKQLLALLSKYQLFEKSTWKFRKEHPYLLSNDEGVIKTRMKIKSLRNKSKGRLLSLFFQILILCHIVNRVFLKIKAFFYIKLKGLNPPFIPDFKSFFESKGFYWNAEHDYWQNAENQIVIAKCYLTHSIQEDTGLIWNSYTSSWEDINGIIIQASKSDTLKEEILKNFNVDITEPNWQHWNGGVFLFNKDSIPFLDTWHEWTLRMFDNPKWHTRDQGTLIATAWKFGLNQHPLLPIKYDFIADYHHPTMQYKGDFIFDVNSRKRDIKPYFVHIYHHFGDKEWKLWQDVEKLLGLSLEAH